MTPTEQTAFSAGFFANSLVYLYERVIRGEPPNAGDEMAYRQALASMQRDNVVNFPARRHTPPSGGTE